MPLFTYACPDHGDMDELQTAPKTHIRCPECKKKAWRVYRPAAKHVVTFRDGWSMSAGRNFSTKRERDNYLAETNTRLVR